ncbi:uncharacterized protein LOC118477848 [Aplysia californica]|uniref:Uncharacterized protein LOC118477848 n=1 Tax=Aplysia californica TaxID=6500 RepID=A0ABM1VUW0_APLCA|nr:uncharacterized protein LOC118477848 [Aplysia californica]
MSEQPRGSAHNDSVSAWSRLEASPYYQTAFYLGLVYPGLLCLLGLPGNLFSALYIRRKWPVAPPQVYMTSLCVVDSLALMHKLLMIHLPTLHVHMTPRGCQYLQFVLQWASQMSSWLLVFLSTFKDRGESGTFKDRGESGTFKDRGESGTFKDRGERGTFKDRGESGTFKDRGESGTFKDRGESGTFKDRGERGTFKDRGESS